MNLRFNLPKSYIMYSNFLSSWALSLIGDCFPCNSQNSRFESCVVLLEHETKSVFTVKFGCVMKSCEIGPVSTPISLAVQENSFIYSCFCGKSPISVFTKCELTSN